MGEYEGQERRWGWPTEPVCRLLPLMEALKAGEHPPVDCLGIVACGRCLGVFEVDYDLRRKADNRVTIETPGHVSCDEGYANHDGHHLDK